MFKTPLCLSTHNKSSRGLVSRLLLGIASLGFVGLVQAAPFTDVPTDTNDGAPDLFDAWNRITGDNLTSNADLEAFRLAPDADQIFTLNSLYVPVLGLTAAYSNTLGFYSPGDSDSAVYSDTPFSGFGLTGDGSSSNPFGSTAFSSLPSGPIGFSLYSNTGSTINEFFSEFALNSSGSVLDHMVAYRVGDRLLSGLFADYGEIQMLNPILIGFEDIVGGGDRDFDDTIFLVDASPIDVPVPATLWLFGVGLLGAGLIQRKY